jgi:hypothetical protein
MRPDLIKKSFQATGVWPMDAEVVLKRFSNHSQQQDEASKIGQHGDGDSSRELRKIYDVAVPDKSKVEARQLEAALHSLQVQNELLHHENEGLQHELNTKKKQTTQRISLTIQEGDEWHGGAVFMSPRKIRTARARKAAEQDEAEQLQLQKAHDRETKAAVTAYRKQLQEEAKVARQQAKTERDRERKARAEEVAAERALKKLQRDAATAQKSRDTANTRKRKASHKAAKIRQSVVVLLLHQVKLTLVRRRRLPHPKTARAAAKSRRQRDTSSANALEASI